MMQVKGFAWLSSVAILMLGCQTQVIGGGTGGADNGSGGSGTSASTSSYVPPVETGTSTGTAAPTPPPDDGPAIAMLGSELPAQGNNGMTSSAAGGPTPYPDSLFLFVSNASQSCGDPFTLSGGCPVPVFKVRIILDPALQAVGTYSLNPLAYAYSSSPEGGDGSCAGGGGSYWNGTIDITAIDATHVDFTLAGTGPLFGPIDSADGHYSAKRCF